MKYTSGRFEKNIASLICICMLLSIAASCVFAENEEITAPERNEKDTAVVEEPSTTQEDVIEEPTPTQEDVVEEPTTTQENVVEEPTTTQEDVIEEPPTTQEEVVEEPIPKQDITDDSAPEGSGTKTPDPAEETKKSALPEENTEDKFDLEKAYEHYLTLEEEQEKEEYLNSLSSEDQTALKEYIEKKEAEAAEADPASGLAVDNENEENEENEESKSVESSTDEKEQGDTSVNEDTLPAVTEGGNENSGDAEEETHISFGCAYIGGEWFGRDTSTVRTLTILINIDGNLVDTCITCAQKSVADFAVYTGDNEIIDVTADYWELSGSGNFWSVDMYGTNNATVNVNMKSPLAAVTEITFDAPAKAPMRVAAVLSENPTEDSATEEITSDSDSEETLNEAQDDIQNGIQEEVQEEQPVQPSFEIRIPVTTISMNKEAETAKLTIDASCRDMDGKRLDVKCISDHNFHFVYGERKDSIEYGLYNDESEEKLGNGQTAASFTGDASANIYLKVENGAAAKYVGDYKDTITFAVAMVADE